jgi:uroporphyrinogen-III synthase
MAGNSRPSIVVVSAPGTLAGIDAPLQRAGVRLFRLVVMRPRIVQPNRWLEKLARARTPDTIIVTSRTAIGAGVQPWRRRRGSFPATVEFWAVGAGTAHALRQAGVRRIHRPPTASSVALAQSLRRKAPRSIVYFRSDVAGVQLARTLRGQGHRVEDVVVYQLAAAGRLSARALREISRADLLVATSPSALSNLKRGLDRRSFERLSRTVPLVVLGERTRRAARGHGFRRTSVAPTTTAQRFTRYLLQELRDAPT